MTFTVATSKICRMAFRLVELRPPQSYSDDSEEAIDARESYPEALHAVLEAYDWSFARKLYRPSRLASLPPDVPADPDLPFVHSWPSGLLIVRRVSPEALSYRVRWRRDGLYLRSDTTPILVRGTADIANEDQCPATFRLVVALQLANLLAPRHLQSRTKRAGLATELEAAMQRATTADAISASASRIDGLHPSTGDDWVGEVLR